MVFSVRRGPSFPERGWRGESPSGVRPEGWHRRAPLAFLIRDTGRYCTAPAGSRQIFCEKSARHGRMGANWSVVVNCVIDTIRLLPQELWNSECSPSKFWARITPAGKALRLNKPIRRSGDFVYVSVAGIFASVLSKNLSKSSGRPYITVNGLRWRAASSHSLFDISRQLNRQLATHCEQ